MNKVAENYNYIVIYAFFESAGTENKSTSGKTKGKNGEITKKEGEKAENFSCEVCCSI